MPIKKETELDPQLLGYLYQHPDAWVMDYDLYESFKSYSRETIHNHLSLLWQRNLIQRSQYKKLERPAKSHFQYYSYRIDQEGKNVINHIQEENKTYRLSLAGLMLAALALLAAFKML